MEQTPPATAAAATSAAQPPEQPQPQLPSLPPPSSTSVTSVPPPSSTTAPSADATTSSSTATTTSINATTSSSPSPLNPSPIPPASASASKNPAPTLTPAQTAQTRPPFNRPWQQPSPYQHFSLPASPSPPPPSSSASSPSTSVPPPRGGVAIGVPAHHPGPPAPPASFPSLTSPSFGQQYSGLNRNLSDSTPSSSTSQLRQPIQGMGLMGSHSPSSSMRPAGLSGQQLRPVQSSLRPQTTQSSQSPTAQTFQGHGMLRVSTVGSAGSPSANTSQSQTQTQPWLSPVSQGKPPLPSLSIRPQLGTQSLQQRSHIPQQQQQTTSGQQPQAATSGQSPEHFGQQFPPPRIQGSLSGQAPVARSPGLGIQRPLHAAIQSATVQPGTLNRATTAETEESCNRILSKRSIQELVTQIDPSEKLDPEVEDILVNIAEDFVESITTFGCSLAKHRKSTTLEAKDILVHLERNWNMTLPGFTGDEIRTYRKPSSSDIHKERLAAIKKSFAAAETANSKSSIGQVGGNAKGHLPKGPANVLGSPNAKIREAV